MGRFHKMPPHEAVEHEMKLRQLPLARLGTPEEVANVIVFLASDLAAFVTSASGASTAAASEASSEEGVLPSRTGTAATEAPEEASMFHAKHDVRVDDVDPPSALADDDVLVRSTYCGICGTISMSSRRVPSGPRHRRTVQRCRPAADSRP